MLRFLKLATPLFVLLLLVGCGGPLKVVYNPPPAEAAPETTVRNRDITIEVTRFSDSRPVEQDPLDIGRISVTVADISGDRLVLFAPPNELLTRAFVAELRTAGYTVFPPDGSDETVSGQADYVLGGELLGFSLDLGSRDRISMEARLVLKDARTGTVVYSGVKKEVDDRYAGVMGNTRGTISKYISTTLSRLARGAIAEASEELHLRAKAAPAPGPAAPTALPAATGIPEGQGRLMVTTGTVRAGVYIDGVYWGLTPITVDLAPGVYELDVRKEGFRGISEKVAVGAGRLTELDSTLKPEQ